MQRDRHPWLKSMLCNFSHHECTHWRTRNCQGCLCQVCCSARGQRLLDQDWSLKIAPWANWGESKETKKQHFGKIAVNASMTNVFFSLGKQQAIGRLLQSPGSRWWCHHRSQRLRRFGCNSQYNAGMILLSRVASELLIWVLICSKWKHKLLHHWSSMWSVMNKN